MTPFDGSACPGAAAGCGRRSPAWDRGVTPSRHGNRRRVVTAIEAQLVVAAIGQRDRPGAAPQGADAAEAGARLDAVGAGPAAVELAQQGVEAVVAGSSADGLADEGEVLSPSRREPGNGGRGCRQTEAGRHRTPPRRRRGRGASGPSTPSRRRPRRRCPGDLPGTEGAMVPSSSDAG